MDGLVYYTQAEQKPIARICFWYCNSIANGLVVECKDNLDCVAVNFFHVIAIRAVEDSAVKLACYHEV